MVLGCSLGLHRLKRGGARLVLALASLLVEGEALEHAVYGVVELRQTLEGRSGGRVEQSPYVRQQRLCLVEEGAQQQRAARLERVAAMHRRACARASAASRSLRAVSACCSSTHRFRLSVSNKTSSLNSA